MPARLFIVARRHPELYEYLSARFADDAGVAVVLDRRLAPRRRRALPAAAERRRADRRARPEIDEQLRATSLAVVTVPKAAAVPTGATPAATATAVTQAVPTQADATQAEQAPAASVSEARQWVESMQRGVQAMRGVLDDHEHLQREAAQTERAHEQLQREARALATENERLRTEIDRSWRELAALSGSVSRAIDVVTDLQSRLHKDPHADLDG